MYGLGEEPKDHGLEKAAPEERVVLRGGAAVANGAAGASK